MKNTSAYTVNANFSAVTQCEHYNEKLQILYEDPFFILDNYERSVIYIERLLGLYGFFFFLESAVFESCGLTITDVTILFFQQFFSHCSAENDL